MADILPDSRLQDQKGGKRIEFGPWGRINMEPVFCANCGKLGAYVPEENCTFACWLCDPCAETMGPITGALMMPDEVFWERVKAEQMEKYGRLLTKEEMEIVCDQPSGAMAKLLKESPIRQQ